MTELDKFQRSDSLCYTSPQTALLISLKNRNFDEFEIILKRNFAKSIEINYFYEDPDNKTLLDIACSSKNNSKFVQFLLDYGANVNLRNNLLKKAPIHLAVLYADIDTLKLLADNKTIDINQPDRAGDTALHLATQQGKTDFVEILLKHPYIEVNKTNSKNRTPLHIAANKKNNLPIIKLLTQRDDIDVDNIRDFTCQTCRDMIRTNYPDFPLKDLGEAPKYDESLFSLLYNRNYEGFVSAANTNKYHLDDDSGECTYLQYACKFGLEPFVQVLLDLGADPNKTSSYEQRTPLMIAAYNGYCNIVQKLVDTGNITYDPIDGNNALHSVLNGIMTCHQESDGPTEIGSSKKRDFYKCLEYLLNNVPCSQLDLNLPDKKGNTVLHYAFKADNRDIIHLLLEKGAYIGHKNFNGEMPVRFMSAETLESYLNDSITTNGQVLGEENFEIIFKYNLLAPPKQFLPKNSKTGYSSESSITDEYEIISETEPLVAISEVSELRPLLKHPLFTAFLNLKWYTIRKYFWINLIFYLIFWSLLTTYVLYIYGPVTTLVASQNGSASQNDSMPQSNTVFQSDVVFPDAKSKVTDSRKNGNAFQNDSAAVDLNSRITQFEESRNGTLLWCATLLFSCILLLREFFQFSTSAKRYITSFENWIEVALVITAHTILLCDMDAIQNRAKLAAVAIFLSWMELVLLIGRHPRVSTYVEMFKVVTLNFLKFLAWYSVLILAFALSFYLLFKDSNQAANNQTDTNQAGDYRFFKDPGIAVFKSAIMATGEYDASNIPFPDDIGTGHLLFVLFIFLVSIVLFNLLNGLAVSDTQAIRKDAELVGIVCRAKLITYIEKMAISDPFPYLGALDKLACCCCCVPIRRQHSEVRKKHFRMFYNRINLFPGLFPDREVRVLANQDNRVVLEGAKPKTAKSDGLSNCYGVQDWRIHRSTVKAAKEILSERAVSAEKAKNHVVTQAITNLQEVYENRLITLENASKRAEDRLQTVEEASKRTEQKLAEIMKLLKEKL